MGEGAAELADEIEAVTVTLGEADECSAELDKVVGDAACDVDELVDPA